MLMIYDAKANLANVAITACKWGNPEFNVKKKKNNTLRNIVIYFTICLLLLLILASKVYKYDFKTVRLTIHVANILACLLVYCIAHANIAY